MRQIKHTQIIEKTEKLSDYYVGFQLNNYFIADNRMLFIAPKNGFCKYCFLRRYLAQFNHEPVSQLQNKALDLVVEIDSDLTSDSYWHLYSIDNKNKLKSFTLSSYDSCPHCNTPSILSKDEAKEVYTKLLTNETIAKLNALKEQIFSFGFASSFISDNKLGFANKGLEKILGGNYYARIIYKLLTHDDCIIEASALGLATDIELATTKAFMEYIERYAFGQQIELLQTTEFDEQLIQNFLSLYKKPVSNHELSLIKERALWGVNLCSGEIHAIPQQFIYNKNNIKHIKPSSSGFGAHISFKNSLVSSILEIIERDAFVRFWYEPLRAYNYIAEPQIQAEIDSLVTVLRIIMKNSSIVSRNFVVKSSAKFPVAMLTISSSDYDNAPSLNFGFGVGFTLVDAVNSALDELRVNVSNLIQGISSVPGFLNKIFHGKIEDIPDRMNFYSTSVPRERLQFLEIETPVPDELYSEEKNASLQTLIQRLSQHNIDIYGIDMTPECFRDKNVYVTRAFSPDLYPLQFIDENVFNLPVGKYSLSGDLPHFFI